MTLLERLTQLVDIESDLVALAIYLEAQGIL